MSISSVVAGAMTPTTPAPVPVARRAGSAPSSGPDAAASPADASGAAEQAAITALRKLVEAAQAKLERLQRAGADDHALQGARLELVTASAALADALAAQARRARDAATGAGGLDTYA